MESTQQPGHELRKMPAEKRLMILVVCRAIDTAIGAAKSVRMALAAWADGKTEELEEILGKRV